MNDLRDETLYWAHLASIEGVSGALMEELVKRFGSLKRAMEAPLHEVREIPLMDPATAEVVCRAGQSLANTQAKLEELQRQGVRVMTRLDNDYPPAFRQSPNPPPVIYQAGSRQPDDDLSVAIIGSRDCSVVTARRAGEYASWLIRQGITIVSGYADGVDMAAHLGALDAGGRTIIMPGCGAHCFDFSPLQSVGITSFSQLAERGLWWSEQPPDKDWTTPGAFARNRLVAAQAKAVLVMEARLHSSTLDTVEKARNLERPVFCQSFGSITQRVMGNEQLRREGAGVINNLADLERIVTAVRGAVSPGTRRRSPEDPRR
jgi:DNA processing protein